MLSLLAAALLQTGSIQIRDALVIEGVARGGRIPFPTDQVQSEIARGTWKPPHEGDKLGTRTWSKVVADKDGNLQPKNPGGAYAFASVDSPDQHVALLRASGHSMVYVNGEPRMGDPYGYGYVVTPVLLKKGSNELLFALGRAGIHASLEQPRSAHVLNLGDPTFPDIREGEKGTMFGAVIVVNASAEPAAGLRLETELGSGAKTETKLPTIPPLSYRKVRVDFTASGNEAPGDIPLKVKLGGEDEGSLTLRVRKREQTYKRTFVSRIDGSVQYYAVNPAPVQHPGQALVLSLHGASVEAIGQADAYSSKPWCNIVCPTNRRPYGFDWEGIGREDAMEVLDVASKELQSDSRQVYLCGHSMGGHGAWTIGAHYPDRFAVVFPSAGWQSFYTYAGQRRRSTDPMGQIFERACADSDTALLVDNLKMPALYGLHGDADDNVPVEELRNMRTLLKEHGIEFAGYHEQPGAGHWWDASPDPGADCVDWKSAFELMQQRRLGPGLGSFDFTTVNPASSEGCKLLHVLQQEEPGKPSRVQVRGGQITDRVDITTSNVRKFSLDLPLKPVPAEAYIGSDQKGFDPTVKVRTWQITIDGAPLRYDRAGAFEKVGGRWAFQTGGRTRQRPREGEHAGGFSSVFKNEFALVYSTHGTPEENAWSFAKARFDSEQMTVRGNGSPEVLADTAVPKTNRRNLVVYSCGKANSALKLVYAPNFGDELYKAAKLDAGKPATCLLAYRPGQNIFAMIAVVQGTSLHACRAMDRLPYFVSGVGYPDWSIFTPNVLEKGAAGVEAAGFFESMWQFDAANSVVRNGGK